MISIKRKVTVTTVAALPAACHFAAAQNGWDISKDNVPEMIALIHSEASEALEAYRHDEPISWTRCGNCGTPLDNPMHYKNSKVENCHEFCDGKPEGIASEFADIVIRVAHYSGLLGIDLADEIQRKLDYNATRGFKHGGKKI